MTPEELAALIEQERAAAIQEFLAKIESDGLLEKVAEEAIAASNHEFSKIKKAAQKRWRDKPESKAKLREYRRRYKEREKLKDLDDPSRVADRRKKQRDAQAARMRDPVLHERRMQARRLTYALDARARDRARVNAKRYHELNKESLNAKKRTPEYREKERARDRARYHRKKAEREAEKEQP